MPQTPFPIQNLSISFFHLSTIEFEIKKTFHIICAFVLKCKIYVAIAYSVSNKTKYLHNPVQICDFDSYHSYHRKELTKNFFLPF